MFRSDGGWWRAVWHEAGVRQQCEVATQEKLAPKLERITERLQADAPNMRQSGADLIARYLDPDRLPVARRWSCKHADTQRRLCERFAAPVITTVACQDISTGHTQTIVNARAHGRGRRPGSPDALRAGHGRDLSVLIESAGDERYRQVLGLCLMVAAYVAVDVTGRWPADADVREIARLVSARGTEIPLEQEDVFDYLSGAALGFRSLPQAMGDDLAAVTLPLFITGTLLFAFRPKGDEWWDYLDQIWNAYEKAEALNVSVLPAVQVRVHMIKVAKNAENFDR